MTRTLLLLAVLSLAAGCDGGSETPDGGSTPDGGASDSGTPDAGKSDSGTADSGTADSGTPDSGTADAGPSFIPCPSPLVEGCGTGGIAYEDRTDAGASRVVTFVLPDGGRAYNPPCLQVKVGQTVRFSGMFASHPLLPRCGPVDAGIVNASGAQKDITFTVAGDYGYFCQYHTGFGMNGAVRVVP